MAVKSQQFYDVLSTSRDGGRGGKNWEAEAGTVKRKGTPHPLPIAFLSETSPLPRNGSRNETLGEAEGYSQAGGLELRASPVCECENHVPPYNSNIQGRERKGAQLRVQDQAPTFRDTYSCHPGEAGPQP